MEVLRIINKVMDRVPENATFQADLQLGQAIMKDGKVTRCADIKATVNVAAHLETACTNYRRNTAQEPEQKKLKELIWQVLDPETLSKFMEKEFDAPDIEYSRIVEEIDKRFNLLHRGHVSLVPDVVMGISVLAEQMQQEAEQAVVPQQATQQEPAGCAAGDLSAVKGGGRNDPNKCARCGGTGHYAWCCPTVPGSGDTRICRGCNGVGHIETQCPTAHPDLKGKGKAKRKDFHSRGVARLKALEKVDLEKAAKEEAASTKDMAKERARTCIP